MAPVSIVTYISQSLPYNAFDAKWIPQSSRIVTCGMYARGTGVFTIYEAYEGKLAVAHQVEKKSAFKCTTLGTSSKIFRTFATGDFAGTVSLWNVDHSDHALFSGNGHSSLINSIDGCGGGLCADGPIELITGSHDGTARLWDIRESESVATFTTSKPSVDCWAVAFGGSTGGAHRCVAMGYANGDLRIFDLRKNAAFLETSLKHGVCSVQFDSIYSSPTRLLVTTLGGYNVFDLTGTPQGDGKVKDSASTVWCGRHLPQDSRIFGIVNGMGAVELNVWSPKKLVHLVSHNVSSNPILSLDWSSDCLGLGVAVGYDQTLSVIKTVNLTTR